MRTITTIAGFICAGVCAYYVDGGAYGHAVLWAYGSLVILVDQAEMKP